MVALVHEQHAEAVAVEHAGRQEDVLVAAAGLHAVDEDDGRCRRAESPGIHHARRTRSGTRSSRERNVDVLGRRHQVAGRRPRSSRPSAENVLRRVRGVLRRGRCRGGRPARRTRHSSRRGTPRSGSSTGAAARTGATAAGGAARGIDLEPACITPSRLRPAVRRPIDPAVTRGRSSPRIGRFVGDSVARRHRIGGDIARRATRRATVSGMPDLPGATTPAGPVEVGPWRRRSRVIEYANPWIDVLHDEVERPDGSPGIYGVVHFRNAGRRDRRRGRRRPPAARRAAPLPARRVQLGDPGGRRRPRGVAARGRAPGAARGDGLRGRGLAASCAG